jgi:hypothetical protein
MRNGPEWGRFSWWETPKGYLDMGRVRTSRLQALQRMV